MSAKINNLRNLRKSDFEIIKEMSLLGAHIIMETSSGLTHEQSEALYNLMSKCGDETLDELGCSEYDYEVNEEIIYKYDDVSFWKVLARKLAARDTIEELGDEVTIGNFNRYEEIRRKNEEMYLEKFKVKKVIAKNNVINFNDKLLPY
ncbi:hypothetical protein [uncultured Clostridium sp.]|uniref:hypothetical protein n=1 Tax=uncultured Clostridium sp. TaxID=59620 RepID=UPI002608320F|nr:hypothetical protein [uncultured Clostridium sp.]